MLDRLAVVAGVGGVRKLKRAAVVGARTETEHRNTRAVAAEVVSSGVELLGVGV